MKNDLINALQDGGEYVFLVEVRQVSHGGFISPSEFIMREDKIQLDAGDINDTDVQKQIDEYMSKNHIEKISLNGNTVWINKQIVIRISSSNITSY